VLSLFCSITCRSRRLKQNYNLIISVESAPPQCVVTLYGIYPARLLYSFRILSIAAEDNITRNQAFLMRNSCLRHKEGFHWFDHGKDYHTLHHIFAIHISGSPPRDEGLWVGQVLDGQGYTARPQEVTVQAINQVPPNPHSIVLQTATFARVLNNSNIFILVTIPVLCPTARMWLLYMHSSSALVS
jgi:hypothetical protein